MRIASWATKRAIRMLGRVWDGNVSLRASKVMGGIFTEKVSPSEEQKIKHSTLECPTR